MKQFEHGMILVGVGVWRFGSYCKTCKTGLASPFEGKTPDASTWNWIDGAETEHRESGCKG